MDPLELAIATPDEDLKPAGFTVRDVRAEMSAYVAISNWRGIWAVACQWLIIAGAMSCAVWSRHWVAYLAAALLIATRQHALAVLMHDQAHYRLLTNRRVADWVSDLLCAMPVGLITSRYRRTHLLHHRFNGTEQDPDWVAMRADADWRWPKSRGACARIFLGDLAGLNTLKFLSIVRAWTPWTEVFKGSDSVLSREERLRCGVFALALLALLAWSNGWATYALLWVAPSMTFYGAIFRLRTLSEHVGLPNHHELDSTRHVEAAWWERLIFAPLNVNHHLEHHLFPAVPFYQLPKVRKRLLEEPTFRERASVCKTYLGGRESVLGSITSTTRGR